MKKSAVFFLLLCSLTLTACGFHLQSEMQLAKPLHRLYLKTSDPYSILSRHLQQNLRLSKVQLVSTPAEAETILVIMQDDSSQTLLSVGGTQQTRQYRLRATVLFEITDAHDRTLLPPQVLTEDRVITVQSNQILGSSNEMNLQYQQMRRALAYAIMNRLASKEVTYMVNKHH